MSRKLRKDEQQGPRCSSGDGKFKPHPSRKFVPGALYIYIDDSTMWFNLQEMKKPYEFPPCKMGDYAVFLYNEEEERFPEDFPSEYRERIKSYFLFNGKILHNFAENLFSKFHRVQ